MNSVPEDKRESATDEDLIEAFATGDLAAFDVIYSRYEQTLRDFHAIRWPREAEEMTQETFVRVVRFPQRYDRQKGPFKSWLFGVAMNTQADYTRRHLFKWARMVQEDTLEGSRARDRNDLIGTDSRTEEIIRVKELIQRLSIGDQEIIFLWLEGYTDEEIASILTNRRLSMRPLMAKGVATRRRRALLTLGVMDKTWRDEKDMKRL